VFSLFNTIKKNKNKKTYFIDGFFFNIFIRGVKKGGGGGGGRTGYLDFEKYKKN
jgi:hypothetical protein